MQIAEITTEKTQETKIDDASQDEDSGDTASDDDSSGGGSSVECFNEVGSKGEDCMFLELGAYQEVFGDFTKNRDKYPLHTKFNMHGTMGVKVPVDDNEKFAI